MNWLDHDLMYSISMTFIHSLWQGIIILGIVTLLKNQISASKTHLIYWIYMSGMGAMMIAWLITFIYFLDVSVSTISESAAWLETAIFTGSSTTDKLQSNNPIFLLLAYGWLFGTSVFLIRAYLGNRKLIRKRKTGFIASTPWQQKVVDLSYKLNLKGKVLLKHSNHINIPLVLGVFKPIILIPSAYFSNLTPIQLEAILMHELTHIKRHDYLANTIQVIIESILFYHPVSWFIGKKIRQYREYICDEHVQSNVDTIPYLEALYRIADFSNSNPSPAVTLYNQKNELIMRVKRMLNKPFLDYHLKPIVYISILVIIAFSQYAFRNIQTANTNDIHTSLDNLQLHDVNQVESTQSMDPVIASFENLKNLQRSFNNLPAVGEIKDTVPPPEKIEELHQKIEATSRELEKMSEHFSQEMETRMGAKMKELEIKSEQLERELEPKMRAMEEKNEFERNEGIREETSGVGVAATRICG